MFLKGYIIIIIIVVVVIIKYTYILNIDV